MEMIYMGGRRQMDNRSGRWKRGVDQYIVLGHLHVDHRFGAVHTFLQHHVLLISNLAT
jgi:hypothetical protein